MRRGLVADAVGGAVVADAPALVEFEADGAVAGVSFTASSLLEELSGERVEAGLRAPALHAVASAMRAAAGARRRGTRRG